MEVACKMSTGDSSSSTSSIVSRPAGNADDRSRNNAFSPFECRIRIAQPLTIGAVLVEEKGVRAMSAPTAVPCSRVWHADLEGSGVNLQ